MLRIHITYLFILGLFSLSCRKDSDPKQLFAKPDHFPEPHFNFENFDLTKDRLELGKTLFYDPILSSDNTVSCASCHHKANGFSDPGMVYSLGVNDSLTTRHSPSLVNLAWNTSFFWDGGVNHLEVLSFAPITNDKEMNENMAELMIELNSNAFYKDYFELAFQADSITDQYLLWSLAAYMAVLISDDSKYDRYLQGKEVFSEKELQGYELFQSDCSGCHAEPLTTNFSFQNNGLDSVFTDLGRESITLDPTDKGKFKVPSLRNVALSTPYMHDGRFETLDQVINHYSSGIIKSSTLNSTLEGGLQYTQDEKEAIKSFLYTLTDYYFINDPNL